MVKLLFEAGAAIDANALAEAVMLEERDIENFLADDCGALPSVLNLDGSSTLHVAAKESDPVGWNGINELLGWYDNTACGESSQFVNNQNSCGQTPLMVGARQPNRGACQVDVTLQVLDPPCDHGSLAGVTGVEGRP